MKKPINLLLLAGAVGIWLFNIIRFVPSTEPEAAMERDLPEIPERWLETAPQEGLIVLEKDPFTLPPVAAHQTETPSSKVPVLKPPPGMEILLLFEREDGYHALVREPGTAEEIEVWPGQEWMGWTITAMDLDGIQLKEQEGEREHVVSFR